MLQIEQADELYSQLKSIGTKAEGLVNTWVKEQMNKENVVEFMTQRSKRYARLIKDLQDAIEMASIPLNLPTKRDVTNVARLTIQNEDRLIAIEEELRSIQQSISRIEEALTGEETPRLTRRTTGAPRSLNREEKALRVQDNLIRLSQALLNPTKLGE